MSLTAAEQIAADRFLEINEELYSISKQVVENQARADYLAAKRDADAAELVNALGIWASSNDADKLQFYMDNQSLFSDWEDYIFFGTLPS